MLPFITFLKPCFTICTAHSASPLDAGRCNLLYTIFLQKCLSSALTKQEPLSDKMGTGRPNWANSTSYSSITAADRYSLRGINCLNLLGMCIYTIIKYIFPLTDPAKSRWPLPWMHMSNWWCWFVELIFSALSHSLLNIIGYPWPPHIRSCQFFHFDHSRVSLMQFN